MLRWMVLPVFCLLTAWAAPCFGVIVLEKGNTESIRGFLVSQNDSRVVIDELLPDGKTRQRVFPRDTIDVLIISVSSERLSALKPDQPRAYRDYADELAEKREDPEARQAAIRLYLLAAQLDPAGQGRSSLLSMAGLARTPAEERRFRAMVYLLDPAHDRSVLKEPSFSSPARTELTDSQQTMLLTAIRALRSGNRREALNFSRRPLFQQVFKRYSAIITLEAFSAAAAQRDKDLPVSLVKQLVTMELLILKLPLQERAAAGDVAWSTILKTKQDAPITPLSLETITEFNPHENIYKQDGWSIAE